MKNTKFKTEELPYNTLEKFGLSQDMIEDLPENIVEEIKDGRMSPVLPISVTGEDGKKVNARTRFAFQQREDGVIDVLFYPVLQSCDLGRFNEAERKDLLDGKAIVAMTTDKNGHEIQAFHQIDPETNHILYVPTPVIGRNLQALCDMLRLTNAEQACLQKGMPITIMDNDNLVTFGIDLNEKPGLRFAFGDEKQWREEQRRNIGEYNFGIYGCWHTDADGNLEYILEEDYDDRLFEEMKKKNMSRSQMALK